MRNITLTILVLFLYNCGYSSIYKNLESQNFQIEIVKTEGDNEMNNLIKNELKLYSNKNSPNIYKLKIETNYEKKVLTKNSSGEITDYSLSVVSKFTINFNEKNEIVKFEEDVNIKNQSDMFEQNIYEKNIKRNFSSSIREKLISAILKINDN